MAVTRALLIAKTINSARGIKHSPVEAMLWWFAWLRFVLRSFETKCRIRLSEQCREIVRRIVIVPHLYEHMCRSRFEKVLACACQQCSVVGTTLGTPDVCA